METTEKKLYTLLVYSENIAGILNQITAVFTPRHVYLDRLNVSASSIEGVHMYTITAGRDDGQNIKITKQIEKKIDVIKADYYTDDQLCIREEGLYKLSTPEVLENPDISRTIRKANARIVEVNPTFCSVMLSGMTEEITGLYYALAKFNCVLQYTRSGRIAITRSTVEEVSDFLEKQEQNRRK